MVWTVYHQMDHSRQFLGQILDAFGLGPVETPFRTAFRDLCVTLRSYGDDNTTGPVLLIIPAPIKRPYIWDIIPEVSVVKRCIEEGLRVYLMYWEKPGEYEQHSGLSHYADRLVLQCLDIIYKETDVPQVFIAGHSLGGTLAAIFTALYPDRVKGIILLGSPLHFGENISVFGPAVAAAPKAENFTELLGNIPGTFLNAVCLLSAPVTFVWSRLIDFALSTGDPKAIQIHLLVERWTLGEFPIPKRLFEEIVDHLYREDRFLRGELHVNNKLAAPEHIDVPILSVIDPQCAVVPPESVLPFHQATRSKDTTTLRYHGDIGVSLQHIGMLVGMKAHQSLWPEIIRWIHSRNIKRG